MESVSSNASGSEAHVPEGASALHDSQFTPLGDGQITLLRHIKAIWYDNGVISSQNFEPMQKDNGKLSLENGNLISPENAWSRWTNWGRQSAVVAGVSVGHFQSVGVDCFADPVHDVGFENPEHVSAHFPSTRSQAKKVAGKIKGYAKVVFTP